MPSPLPAASLTLVALLLAASPAAAQDEDFGVWIGQFAAVDVSPGIFVRAEAQERFKEDAGGLGQLLVRTLVAARLGDKASIGAGYAYVLTEPRRVLPGASPGPGQVNEHRTYQEFNLRLVGSAGGLTVDSRSRIEQRFFEEDGRTGHRLREFVQLRAPLAPGRALVAYSEPFVNLNTTPLQRAGLGLWRNFAGVGFALSPGVEIVPGYLNQRVFQEGADRTDHTASVNLFMNF
jgi:hypothetical protein